MYASFPVDERLEKFEVKRDFLLHRLQPAVWCGERSRLSISVNTATLVQIMTPMERVSEVASRPLKRLKEDRTPKPDRFPRSVRSAQQGRIVRIIDSAESCVKLDPPKVKMIGSSSGNLRFVLGLRGPTRSRTVV